jgi:hypothetical protein
MWIGFEHTVSHPRGFKCNQSIGIWRPRIPPCQEFIPILEDPMLPCTPIDLGRYEKKRQFTHLHTTEFGHIRFSLSMTFSFCQSSLTPASLAPLLGIDSSICRIFHRRRIQCLLSCQFKSRSTGIKCRVRFTHASWIR